MPDHSAINAPSVDALNNKTGSKSDDEFRKQAGEVLKAAEVARWPGGNVMPASELWDKQPMFIFVVRRPGCQFCRAHAVLIGHTKLLLSKLGFGFAAVVASKRQDEIEGFGQKAWMGKIYTDDKFAFLTALGGNEIRKGSYWHFFTIHFAKVLMRNLRQKMEGNVSAGEGNNFLGGMFLIEQGGDVLYWQQEKTFGDFGSLDDIIRKAYEVSARKSNVDLSELEHVIEDYHERKEQKLVMCTDDACAL